MELWLLNPVQRRFHDYPGDANPNRECQPTCYSVKISQNWKKLKKTAAGFMFRFLLAFQTAVASSGSSGWVREEAEKHEIYVAALSGHLFYDLFSQGRRGAMAPLPPLDPLLVADPRGAQGMRPPVQVLSFSWSFR